MSLTWGDEGVVPQWSENCLCIGIWVMLDLGQTVLSHHNVRSQAQQLQFSSLVLKYVQIKWMHVRKSYLFIFFFKKLCYGCVMPISMICYIGTLFISDCNKNCNVNVLKTKTSNHREMERKMKEHSDPTSFTLTLKILRTCLFT